MNIQSVAIASGTEAGPAETMVKAAASAEETEDAALAGRGARDRRDDDNTVSGENRRHRRDENREDGRKWGGRDKKASDRKYSGDRAEREVKKRKKREEPGIGNSFPKRKKS